jgi:hypothetical protein
MSNGGCQNDCDCDACFYRANRERDQKKKQEAWGKLYPKIDDWVEKLKKDGFTVRMIEFYQYRVNEILDVFPMSKRYFDIKGKHWGYFDNLPMFVREFFKKTQ